MRGNDSQTEFLARIVLDREPVIFNISLPGVAVEKPGSLILENVNLSYNGTYKFLIWVREGIIVIPQASEVVVHILGKLFCLFA